MPTCAKCSKFVASFTYPNPTPGQPSWCDVCYRTSPVRNPYVAKVGGTLVVAVKPKMAYVPYSQSDRNALFNTWGRGRRVQYHTSAQHIYKHITGVQKVDGRLEKAQELSAGAERGGPTSEAGMSKNFVSQLLADKAESLQKEVWSVVLQLTPDFVAEFAAAATPILGTVVAGTALVKGIKAWYDASSMKTVTAHVAFSLPRNNNVTIFCNSLEQLCIRMETKAQIDTAQGAVKLVAKVVSDVLAPTGAGAVVGVTAAVVDAIAKFTVLVYNVAYDLEMMQEINDSLADCSVSSFEACPWLAVFALGDLETGLATSTMLDHDMTKTGELGEDHRRQLEAERVVINRLQEVAKRVAKTTRLKLVPSDEPSLSFARLDDNIIIASARMAM